MLFEIYYENVSATNLTRLLNVTTKTINKDMQ
jgi:hypothetical protein